MIKKINLKQVATYDTDGAQIDNLKKINFIYGANGCGKTTISNYLQNPKDTKYEDCTLETENTQEIKTLVYNKEFRNRNFGKGKLGGIFTLGEATNEEIKTIEEKIEISKTLKADERRMRETLESQIQKKETLMLDFKEFSWKKIYKKYEPIFKDAFVGSISKEKFKDRLLQESTNNISPISTFDSLKAKAKTIFGEVPQSIFSINEIEFNKILEIENTPIWQKIIVGKSDVDIAKLIQKLNINDWVNEGRTYIQDDKNCPFCQQKTITKDFKNQLDSFFDDVFVEDIKLIKELKEGYNLLTSNLIHELNTIESNQRSLSDTKLNIEKFSACLKTVISLSTTNNQLLNNKIKEPSRSIELVKLKEQLELISGLITDANFEIKKHNDIVVNFKVEKEKLIQLIWKYIADEFSTELGKFNTENKGFQKGIDSLNGKIEAKSKDFNLLNSEIKNLNKNVTSIQPTIDEINRLLKTYGFTNFKIVPADDEGFYQIKREDGTIAETTLSEGEITFITFLYYLQLAKGGESEDTVTDERILVIDDPICSLDSNILFVVSTLIKEIIKGIKSGKGNIKQIIVLTHNIYFHKEVSYEDRKDRGEKALYWIIRKNQNRSTIQSYGEKNPIKSSYELLWREIKEWQKSSGITIQNTMRRILENFFNILGNKRNDFLVDKFSSAEEKSICRSLLSWTNEGSHTFPDDLFVETPEETISRYLVVFKNIFTHTENKGHYNMMMEIKSEDD